MHQDQLDSHLGEAQRIIDGVQHEKRSITQAEKAIVQDHLAKAQELKEYLGIAKAVELARGPVNGGSASASSTGLGTKATVTVSTGGLPNAYDTAGTLQVASEGFRFRNLFPTQFIEAPSVWYRQITTGSAQAAAVAEAAAKPEATIVAAQVEAVARKLAVFAPVSDEVLADGGRSFFNDIVADLTRDLVRVENAQLANGSGIAPNLRGILNTTGIQTRARGTDSNLDALLKALTMLRTVAFMEPTDILVNPTNFEAIRLAKDTTNAYVLGDPLYAGQPSIAGASVHLTTDLPLGTALVINAGELAKVYVREDISIKTGYSAAGLTSNVTSIVAEERLAFAVRRPAAAVSVTALT